MITVPRIHVEPTTRCTLACPKCARTEMLHDTGSLPIVDLDFDSFVQFFDVSLSGVRVDICGNLGDPIYYPKLIELCTYIKSEGGSFYVCTNGSYKPKSFWDRLAKVATADDEIEFSIDGLPNNFTEYRVNGDWDSIEKGIRTIAETPALLGWKYIPFRYNEDNIDEARELANSLGVKNFSVRHSNRWNEGEDDLRPIKLYKHPRPGSGEFRPECLSSAVSYFISADGYFYPCCFMADYRLVKGTIFEQNAEFHISNTTYSKVMQAGSTMANFLDHLETNKTQACRFCCTF